MAAKAYVALTSWPFEQLSTAGQVSSLIMRGVPNHCGIVFIGADPARVAVHSEHDVSVESARGQPDVSFDFLMDLRPRFQGIDDPRYFSPECRTELYAIDATRVDVARLHAECAAAARDASVVNSFWNRAAALLWFAPAAVLWPLRGRSTCAALVLRLCAKAARRDIDAHDDEAVRAALGLASFSLARSPMAPTMLCGFTPVQALNELVRVGVCAPVPVVRARQSGSAARRS